MPEGIFARDEIRQAVLPFGIPLLRRELFLVLRRDVSETLERAREGFGKIDPPAAPDHEFRIQDEDPHRKAGAPIQEREPLNSRVKQGRRTGKCDKRAALYTQQPHPPVRAYWDDPDPESAVPDLLQGRGGGVQIYDVNRNSPRLVDELRTTFRGAIVVDISEKGVRIPDDERG